MAVSPSCSVRPVLRPEEQGRKSQEVKNLPLQIAAIMRMVKIFWAKLQFLVFLGARVFSRTKIFTISVKFSSHPSKHTSLLFGKSSLDYFLRGSRTTLNYTSEVLFSSKCFAANRMVKHY